MVYTSNADREHRTWLGLDQLEDRTVPSATNGLVAVIDTGVDYTHPELQRTLFTNPNEVAGDGIDNDGNGLTDDIHGYDFANNDADPMDDNGHGTNVAGVIVQAFGGHTGSMMYLKAADASGHVDREAVIKAVRYAEQAGATVANLSIDIRGWNSDQLRRLVGAAGGMAVVVAAGNDGREFSLTLPANFIVVGATTAGGELADFSGRGAEVDAFARGVDVRTAALGGGSEVVSGTSVAAAWVSGDLAARFAGHRPGAAWSVQLDAPARTGAEPVASGDESELLGLRRAIRKVTHAVQQVVNKAIAAVKEVIKPVYSKYTTNNYDEVRQQFANRYGGQNIYMASESLVSYMSWTNLLKEGAKAAATGGASLVNAKLELARRVGREMTQVRQWLEQKGVRQVDRIIGDILAGREVNSPYLAVKWTHVDYREHVRLLGGAIRPSWHENHPAFVLIWK